MTEASTHFGYTRREWAFLCLAAPVSGYFRRSQFNQYIGKECGAAGQVFIERGLERGHFKALQFSGGRVLYHASALPLYEALGEGDSRNRRSHSPYTIRRRLMALDFCILSRGSQVLATESEQLAHLSRFLGGDAASIQKPNFLLDKQPIRITPDGKTELAFIDCGFRTSSQWELFLKRQREYLQQLDKVAVVYAGYDPRAFQGAERIFRRIVAGQTGSGGADVARLNEHFASRRLFEEGRFDSFDQSRLDELREARRVFAGPKFELLFSRWRLEGDAAFEQIEHRPCEFRGQILPNFYEWLSPIPVPERRANAHNRVSAEKEPRGRHGQTRQVDN